LIRNSGPLGHRRRGVPHVCLRDGNSTGAGEHPHFECNPAVWAEHDSRYALVVAGGKINDLDKAPVQYASLVIAADSGAEFLKKHNLAPDIITGDFDSCDPETISYFRNLGIEIISFRKDKDKTDTEIALDLALKRGFTTAVVTGAMRGSRLDHELANVFLIEYYARQGLDLILYSRDTVIFGIAGLDSEYQGDSYFNQGKRAFFGEHGDWVTILPVTYQAKGVTTSNLRFPLYDATLQRGSTLGVSNEMLGKRGRVSLSEGFVVIVLSSHTLR